MPQPRLSAIVLVCLAALAPGVSRAATWSVDASVSDERRTDVTADGSDTTETVDQSYSISYELQIHPTLTFTLDLGLDITDEINEPDYDTREVQPSVEMELQGPWWTLTGSWETSEKSSHDPEVETTRDDSWDAELTMEPAGEALPDLKLSFQRDLSKEGGVTQTVDTSREASLDYALWDLLDLSFDVRRDTTDDRINPDSDTEDRDYSVDISFDREFGDRFKLEAQWTNERQQSLTLSDDGDVLQRDDSLKNNVQAQITFDPLDDLELSLDREIDWDKDLEQAAPVDVTDTWTGEISYGRALTDTIDIDLDYSDERKDTRGAEPGSYSITRDYSAALDFSPIENITISPSFDRSDQIEWFADPTQTTDDTLDDTWEIQLDSSFWNDQVAFTVTRTWNQTTENGERSTNERNWDLEFTLSYEGLPNLTLTPDYTYTEDEDLLTDTVDVERQWEVGIQYELTLGDVTTLSLDHTYTRTHTDPAEGKSTIRRDDDTDLTLSLTDFFDGMGLELSLTRKASDESEDDQGPTVDYTYSASYDWTIFDQYDLSYEYQLDKKSEAEDTRNHQITLSAEFLEGLLSVNFEWELDQQLEGDRRDTHRYLIEVQGQF